MTIKGLVRAFALSGGLAAIMQAGTYRSEDVAIPFAFSVHGTVLPAGTYHMEQDAGKEIATLVNKKTGERVQLLRPSSMHEQGRLRLQFQASEQGYKLKVS